MTFNKGGKFQNNKKRLVSHETGLVFVNGNILQPTDSRIYTLL